MLAYLAAREYDAIDDLALWAVPDRGRTLLREGKSLSKVIASDFPEDQGRDPAAAGDLELIGYLMTAETQAALSRAAAERARHSPVATGAGCCCSAAAPIRVDQRLQDSLERQGAEVAVLRTTDYYALMVKPEQSQTPEATVAPRAGVAGARARGGRVQVGAASAGRPRGCARHPSSRSLAGWSRVRSAAPAATASCSGSSPATRRPVRRPLALLLLSSGALPHTGPNRAWVEVARRWAARGIPTVRLDLAGIGEAGGEDPELMSDESPYESWRVDDVRAVLDQLQAAGIAERFVLGGLCSGANCSLQGALADSRVCGVLLINLFLVTWSGELIAERIRRAAIADGLPIAGVRSSRLLR